MLVPSSNTVAEPQTAALLAGLDVSTHVSRVGVTQITSAAASLDQFTIGGMLTAARLLADAEVDLILWNGTAASWLGFGFDDELVAAIERETGIPATTALIAVNAALAAAGARSIGLVTPYVADIEARIMRNFAGHGIRVAAAVRADLTANAAYAAIASATIADMVRAAARSNVDAVVVLCTNLAGAGVAPDLAAELDVPVIDSVRCAVEHSLTMMQPSPIRTAGAASSTRAT